MPLTPGTRLGTYEVTGSLGAGGMGEVYRARDHRLGRDVALKILPQAFAQDPDRLARFEREARTLAALNHPNIAAIYGIEESGGLRALVMELVPGRTLDQISSSASRSSVGESISIARAIAEGLEAAHDAGIIHRDLKPANVKVRDDGQVKVLDFGLAKTADDSAFGSPQAEAATLTSPAVTQAGLILGTAAYMAPEQARGKPVDKRADVWAFGVVLYELLTGGRLFNGETVSDVVAAVLTKPVDLAALPAEVPARVRELVARCLERDPKKRLRDIGEARIVLEAPEGGSSLGSRPPEMSVAAASQAPAVAVTDLAVRRTRGLPGWVWVTVIAIVVGGYLGAKQLNRAPALTATAGQGFRLEIGAPPAGEFSIVANVGSVIVSPDGTMVAFAVQAADGTKLFIRNLLTGETSQLPGISGPQYPFWSPDSKKIGLFLGNQLATIAIAGGLPEMIATAVNGRGGAWTDNGTILYSPIGGGTIFRVSERGGEAKQITTLDEARGENAHYWPVALPGGKKFLFFVRSRVPENNGIYLGSVDGAVKPVRVMTSLSSALYAPPRDGQPGKLLWVRDAELLAQAFDPETAALSGEVSSVAKDVRVEESQRGTFASVSNNGTVVWASARAADFQFVWYDRSGKRLGVVAIPTGKVLLPDWAPDGHAIAYTRAFGGSADILQYDVASGAIRTLTTSPDYDEFSRWSPDSTRIAYQGRVGGKVTLLVAPVDGSAPPVAVANPPGLALGCFTADGKSLVITYGEKQTNVGLVRLSKPGTIEPLGTDSGVIFGAAMSPNGRWLAFSTVAGGKPELVIAPFSDDGKTATLSDRRIQISTGGGYGPVWRKDGREITYSALDSRVMSVTFSGTGNAVVPGSPVALFKTASPINQTIAFTANAELGKFVIVESPFARGERLQVLTGWK